MLKKSKAGGIFHCCHAESFDRACPELIEGLSVTVAGSTNSFSANC